MPTKLTSEQFIQNARNVHGLIYDYSLVNYINNSTPVDIRCSFHGIFRQKPNVHVDGKSGCPTCGRKKCDYTRKLSQEEFITRAKQVHSGKYTYEKTVYEHNSKSVLITCIIHGDFWQEAYSHIKRGRESGCPRCGRLGISGMSIKWMEEIASTNHIHIQHALNGGEFKIPTTRYKADGYCAELNTIYEFYGDKWHGNLNVYAPSENCHPFSSKTARQLYEFTLQREAKIKSLGYKIVSVWEHDFCGEGKK